jgi:hypothetical protein
MICRTRKEIIDARMRQAFISYAHVEEKWKTRLVDALAPLTQDGLVETWHDGALMPGDRWHQKILTALDDADLVLLLVSRAFLESEYVRDTELPLAIARAETGRSRLVPIILDSCDWTKQPFAKFQALPGDRVPLAERSDIDQAISDCVTRLRQIFDAPDDKYGAVESGAVVRALPLLRVTFDFAEPNWPDWSALIDGVRQIAASEEVRTNLARRITPASNRWEWLLEGPEHVFAAVESVHNEGRLSDLLGVRLVSVERALGASYFSGTYLADAGHAPPPISRLVSMGDRVNPPLLFGIAVRPSEPGYLQPFFTKNGNSIEDEDWQREKQKLLSYFHTVLAVPGEDMHVNFSAFEAGRVMPANLARTELGRLLAEQDCLLKRVTASMLHPDHPHGKVFWERIEALAYRRHGSDALEMWQRVWIIAGSANLNEKSAGQTYDHPLPPGIEVRQEDWFGHLSECTLRVMCETDYLALENRVKAGSVCDPKDSLHQDGLEIFRETILPALEDEVNTGSHFAPLRQVYWTVGLAKWYREQLAEPGLHTRLIEVAAEVRRSLGNSSEIGSGPDAPTWVNECYAHYLDLLHGVFRVAKPEPNTHETGTLRVYHSGGLYLD